MFSSNGLSIMSLLAALCFAGVLALQLVENSFYGALPSLWP